MDSLLKCKNKKTGGDYYWEGGQTNLGLWIWFFEICEWCTFEKYWMRLHKKSLFGVEKL